MRNILLLTLLIGICTNISGQSDATELFKQLEKTEADSQRLHPLEYAKQKAILYEGLSELYVYIQLDSSYLFARRSLNYAYNSGDPLLIAEAYLRIGTYFWEIIEKDSAQTYLVKAKSYYERMNREEDKQLKLLELEGIFANLWEEDDKMVAAYFQLAEAYKKRGNWLKVGESYYYLSFGFFFQRKYKEAKQYEKKAREIYEQYGSRLHYANILYISSFAYMENQEYEKADSILQRSFDIIEGYNCPILRSRIIDAYVRYLLKVNQLNNVEELIGQGIAYAKRGSSQNSGKIFLRPLGQYYLAMGNYKKAISTLRDYLEYAETFDNPYVLVTAQEKLAETYANFQQYDSAYYYLQLYTEAEAENTSKIYDERIAQLQTQYEIKEKESTIQTQQTQLQRQRWTIGIGAFFTLLFLTGAAILFYLTQQLRQRNEEKEFLIKEVHHRVKNNLQTLASLLHLQSRHIEDEVAISAVQKGQNRVEAMGLIHQKLYTGEHLAVVEMRDYLVQLGEGLLDSFGFSEEQINLQFYLEELRLDVDTAIPLSLIINELITNSLKYAFPNGKKGRIAISLWKDSMGSLHLKVEDDGVGKQRTAEHQNSTAFGFRLIKILSKKLKGTPESLKVAQGYATQIRFDRVKFV